LRQGRGQQGYPPAPQVYERSHSAFLAVGHFIDGAGAIVQQKQVLPSSPPLRRLAKDVSKALVGAAESGTDEDAVTELDPPPVIHHGAEVAVIGFIDQLPKNRFKPSQWNLLPCSLANCRSTIIDGVASLA
jgi:hypothetical protein